MSRRRHLSTLLPVAIALGSVTQVSPVGAAATKPTTLTFVAAGSAAKATITYGLITKPVTKTVKLPHTETLTVTGDIAAILRVTNAGTTGDVSCRINGVLVAGKTERVAKAWAQCNLQRFGTQGGYTSFGGDTAPNAKATTTKR